MLVTPRVSRTVGFGFAAGAALTLAGFTPAPASASVIIADNFNGKSGSNTLQGTTVSQSISATLEQWGSNAFDPVTVNGQVTVRGVSGQRFAFVDIPTFAPSAVEPIVSLSADINVEGAQWIQVALAATPTSGDPNVFNDNQIGLRVTETDWELLASASDTLIASGTGDFDAGTFAFEVRYDSTDNTVDVLIDGSAAAADQSLNAFTPDLGGSAIIHFTPGSNGFIARSPRVDNFLIETVVPEPGSFWLLALGVTAVLSRKQKAGG